MAIQFPGGTTVYEQIAADDKPTLIDAIKTQLVAAGMTAAALYSYATLTFNSPPGNNQVVTIDGQAYRFVNTLSAAFDVLIGADAAACATALDAAINDSGGEGVLYGTGTTPHTTVTSSINGTVVTVTNNTGGTDTFPVTSTAGGNITLSGSSSHGGGWMITTAKTPQGLQAKLKIYDSSASVSYISIDVIATDDPDYHSIFILSTSATRILEICANKYQVFVWLLSAAGVIGCEFQFTVPYIRDGQKAPVVSAVSDSGGLYKISTASAHNLTTGDHVFISGAEGQTGINGNWPVTVIDANNYTLDGSTYASGYTADSAVSASYHRGQIARHFLACGYAIEQAGRNWRTYLHPPALLAGGKQFVVLNQFQRVSQNDIAITAFAGTFVSFDSGPGIVLNWGLIPDQLEPRLACAPISGSSSWFLTGQVWGAIFVMQPVLMDVTKNPWNSHNWINYSNNTWNGSLWLATN